MIGVIAKPEEHAAASEFFELFKTPWELYRDDGQYEVLLCAGGDEIPDRGARLIVVYGGQRVPFDGHEKIGILSEAKGPRMLSCNGGQIPIYGGNVTFENGAGVVVHEAAYRPGVVARIGYDLFREVRALLTRGQTAGNASIPTLELHIALLRHLIVESGVPLVEIPPVPDGHRFLACLTHDIDHPSLRWQKFDHAVCGFLYRAIFGSLLRVIRGRLPARDLLRNWAAALKLPLVHLGLARDIWQGFDRYVRLEGGLRSSFFVIPFKHCPGRSSRGAAPSRRASRYGASDIVVRIRELLSAGSEIGVHGIDAWIDSSKGRAELEQVRGITGRQDIGIRMHWLYFDEQSPAVLERAGFAYDSTVGYNETVGYRAGTPQAYKPLEAARLLELPMHIMDTALFFPCYLNLSPKKAREQVGQIIENAVQFGGCVTVNWHDRSIFPERLWGDFYLELVDTLKSRGAWFSTTAEAASWFRKRRSVVFEAVNWESGAVRVKIGVEISDDLPNLQLRVYNGQGLCQNTKICEDISDHKAGLRMKHTFETRVTPTAREQMQKEQVRVQE